MSISATTHWVAMSVPVEMIMNWNSMEKTAQVHILYWIEFLTSLLLATDVRS